MLFNSWKFVVFFLVVLAVYRSLRNLRLQNLLLLAASYFFYSRWSEKFLLLLIFTTIVDYFAGVLIADAQDPRRRKAWLMVSLGVNLGVLGFFKYFNFGIESFGALLEQIGLHPSIRTLSIVLPVGISFYTFQSMSYTIDVYRGKIAPTRNFFDFALYVAYFPQLLAGPIERVGHMMPQFQNPRPRLSREDVRVGLTWILLGYFKKVVLADTLGFMVDNAYAHTDDMTGAMMFVAGAAFALQVYCDFAGYTLIARGISRLLGIDLMRNFRMPFLARTTREAWTRWHISFSTWLRDYLYIPLGGSRGSKLFHYRNLMLTMLLGGLWHGAAWPKVLWGGWNGLLLVFDAAFRGRRKEELPAPLVVKIWQVCATMTMWIFGLIIFRSSDMGQAREILAKIFTDFRWTDELIYYLKPTVASYALIYAYFIWQERTDDELVLLKANRYLRLGIYTFLLVSVLVVGFRPQPFFYFQF